MTVHKLRKFTLLTAMLLFPVTIYYMSPYLIFQAAFQSAVNGSFILFCLMTVLSVPFGRIFCAFLCPAGALQECAAQVTEKPAKRRKLYVLKYVIWAVWLSAVTVCYVINGIDSIDPFFYDGTRYFRVADTGLYHLLRDNHTGGDTCDDRRKKGVLPLFLLDGAFYGGRYGIAKEDRASGTCCGGEE